MQALKQFSDVLKRTERLTPDGLAAYQRKPLEKLLRHAIGTVPIYKDRLTTLFRADGSIDWEKWADVPFTNRAEIQARNADFVSSDSPVGHGEVSADVSSGSTGQPIEIQKTELANVAYWAVRARYHDWHGIDRDLKYASIRHAGAGDARYPTGAHNDIWAAYGAFMGLDCHGPEAILNINTPIDQQAEWLLREQPDYLHTFPTNAAALADLFASNPAPGPALDLKTILTLSETVTPEIRQRCHDVFGAKLIDNYNSVECGYFAIQCSDHTHYHVQSEVVLLEVLDDNDRPCQPGEMGRIIATPFYNYAMPLIRYDTNDFGIVGEACDCGRHSPVLSRIVGRSRNLFRFPDNIVVTPELTGGPFATYLRPRQWQVAQIGPLELEVRFIPSEVRADMDFDGMTSAIRQALRDDLTVTYKMLTALPTTSAGKHEPYVCELPVPD